MCLTKLNRPFSLFFFSLLLLASSTTAQNIISEKTANHSSTYERFANNENIKSGFDQPTKSEDSTLYQVDHSTLFRGQRLIGNKKLISSNGKFQCRITPKGHLTVEEVIMADVLDGKAGTAILKEYWSPQYSEGNGGPGSYLLLQEGDGNLCFYTADNHFRWCASSSMNGERLELKNNGDLIVYDAEGKINWSSAY